MGYEVKISVVQHRNDNVSSDGWCSVLATLELSKIGDGAVIHVLQKYRAEQEKIPKKKKYFFYDNYSNREFKVFQDRYDDYMPLVPISEFYEALVKNNEETKASDGHGYRRFELAIALLKPFVKSKQWKYERNINSLYVMAWGH